MPISRIFAALISTVLLISPSLAAEHPDASAQVAGAPSYVRFNPIFVPVIVGNQVTRQVGVTLILQLVEGQDKDGVEAKRAQLNDAFIQELYVFFQSRAALQGRIDQAYLKARLLKSASRVAGANTVQEVLIEQLFERPR